MLAMGAVVAGGAIVKGFMKNAESAKTSDESGAAGENTSEAGKEN